jgi:hypothetical protein
VEGCWEGVGWMGFVEEQVKCKAEHFFLLISQIILMALFVLFFFFFWVSVHNRCCCCHCCFAFLYECTYIGSTA